MTTFTTEYFFPLITIILKKGNSHQHDKRILLKKKGLLLQIPNSMNQDQKRGEKYLSLCHDATSINTCQDIIKILYATSKCNHCELIDKMPGGPERPICLNIKQAFSLANHFGRWRPNTVHSKQRVKLLLICFCLNHWCTYIAWFSQSDSSLVIIITGTDLSTKESSKVIIPGIFRLYSSEKSSR